jgi:hypothetical protein
MAMEDIAYCKIHPGIGIARLGNSPDEFFIGPETPGHPAEPAGGFKDASGRVKRQAARFRIYGYDARNAVVQEVTLADARIVWTVHLTNAKAAWHQFANRHAPEQPLRNPQVTARERLVIDPGPRTISGARTPGLPFDRGRFLDVEVPLGEIRTDDMGRLLVLGGAGCSQSAKPNNPIRHYANNDGWHDDTSDGPVTAQIVLKNGVEVPVTPAWVIAAPPKFAPHHVNLITLYEVMGEVAMRQGWLAAPTSISFTRDIYPLLSRISAYSWVNATAFRGHGPGAGGDFLADPRLHALADAGPAQLETRQALFRRIRIPPNASPPPDDNTRRAQANFSFMPQLAGDMIADHGDVAEGVPETWLTLLATQYENLRQWAEGNFEADWPGAAPVPPPFYAIPVPEQPAALDRAALEWCAGGPFYPGIEITYIAEDPKLYLEPYRFQPRLEPGAVTRPMALPWQADFYECNTDWWPAQRPDDVLPEREYLEQLRDWETGGRHSALVPLLTRRLPWARGLPDDEPPHDFAGDNALARSWHELGFVVQRRAPTGETVYVETDRNAHVGTSNRDAFHYLLNIDDHQDFLPKARAIVEQVLADAWAYQSGPDLANPEMAYFPYTEEAFEARLDAIYQTLVDQAADYDPNHDPNVRTRADVVQRLLQFAPFNQIDGAWLRNATPTGPIDDLRSLLFAIWMDEVGDGMTDRNHSNIYTDLLHSLGIYLPAVDSRAYADNPALLDVAFEAPVFELAISQFSEDFLPEILGMTLQIEWEVVFTKPVVQYLKLYGIDPHFFTMHIAIDNAASGHGAKAKQAVKLFLDEVRGTGGEEAVQRMWQRIWTGYVAFGNSTGDLHQELADMLAAGSRQASLADRMQAMIVAKQPYGAFNHGDKQLGGNRINDWFADPEGFLKELERSGLVVAGRADLSPIFDLMSFTGPMYKVFTDDEIALWQAWIRSLAHRGEPAPAPEPSVVESMARLVVTMRERQMGAAGHDVPLSGPDPARRGQTIARPLSWWFQQKPLALMRVLSVEANGWVVKGHSERSPLVTQMLAGKNPMAQVLLAPAPWTRSKTYRDIVVDWIDKGCPLTAEPLLDAAIADVTGRRVRGRVFVH